MLKPEHISTILDRVMVDLCKKRLAYVEAEEKKGKEAWKKMAKDVDSRQPKQKVTL